jgi:hypothetical protein
MSFSFSKFRHNGYRDQHTGKPHVTIKRVAPPQKDTTLVAFLSFVSITFNDLNGTVPTGGRGGSRSGRGPWARLCCICFCLLGSIKCNSVVICHVDSTCGQRPCCIRCSLLCFPYFFPLVSLPLMAGSKKFSPGPKPDLGGPGMGYYPGTTLSLLGSC